MKTILLFLLCLTPGFSWGQTLDTLFHFPYDEKENPENLCYTQQDARIIDDWEPFGQYYFFKAPKAKLKKIGLTRADAWLADPENPFWKDTSTGYLKGFYEWELWDMNSDSSTRNPVNYIGKLTAYMENVPDGNCKDWLYFDVSEDISSQWIQNGFWMLKYNPWQIIGFEYRATNSLLVPFRQNGSVSYTGYATGVSLANVAHIPPNQPGEKDINYTKMKFVVEYPDSVTTVREPGRSPETFQLSAYPNPFNPSVTLRIDSKIPVKGDLQVEIFSALGQLVEKKNVLAKDFDSEVKWEPDRAMGSGVYLVRIKNNTQVLGTTRVIFAK